MAVSLKRYLLAVLVTTIALTLFQPVEAIAQTQGKRISVSFKDKPLATILDFVGRQGDYEVSYTDDVRNDTLTVTISFENVDALQAVQSLLAKTAFAYNVDRKKINVYRMEQHKETAFTLKGLVKDKDGQPVSFATVQIKGTTQGTTTDLDGHFTMKVDRQEGNVTISSVGFETKTMKYDARHELSVLLPSSEKMLGEVAVIAYGKRNTREQVGAIGSVKAEDLQKVPSPSLENLLQGRIAGVDVTNLSGSPGGGGSKVTIRGFSSLNQQGVNDGTPLYVVDGVPVANDPQNMGGINALAGLDPSSIESVQVLKDAASASLYGSRAGNGVILITTKKGKAGHNEIQVNVSQSLSWLPATPKQTIGKAERDIALMLAKKYRSAHYNGATDGIVLPNNYADTWGWGNDLDGGMDYLWRNGNVMTGDGKISPIMQDSLNTFYNNRTNWWKYGFRLGRVTKADVQLAGGTENMRYMANAGVYDETGIMINSNFRRYSLLTNLDFKLSTKLDMFIRINMAYTDQSAGSGGRVQGLTFDPKQTPSVLPGKGSTAEREAVKQLRDIDQTNSNYNLRLNGGFNYSPIKGLKFTSTASIDHYFTRIYIFRPSYLMYDNLSEARGSNAAMTNLQTENILTYNMPLPQDHKLELMAGVTYNYDLMQTIGGWAKGGPTNQVKYVGEGWPTLLKDISGEAKPARNFDSNKEDQAMLSFLGRAAYGYKKKYLGEFSVRRDGSSVFGSNVRWGTFPSVGLGWAFSEERFMKKLWWLSFAKLRASWGRSGQKFQEPYLALGVLSETDVFNGTAGLVPAALANKDLTWENSDQYDVGLDLQVLDYRLKFKLDYYYKYSSNLLMQKYLPGNFFYTGKVWDNISAISNEGIEFDVQADLIRSKDLNLSVGLNVSHNRNLFRKTDNGEDLNDKVLGRPVYGIYTYQDEGIVKDESQIPYHYSQTGVRMPLYFVNPNYPLRVGGRKIKDQNMDGRIDNSDLYYAGSTLPTAYGGVNAHLDWKGFNVDLLFSYVLGRKVMNMVQNSAFTFNKSVNPLMAYFKASDYWSKDNPNATKPALEFADPGYLGHFDGNVDSNIENISFLRLKQLVLGYTLPAAWFKSKFVKSVNVYLSGENLFMLSNYTGLDPEVIDPYTGKDDGSQYPLNRKLTFGINVKF
ncbi:MAG: SusC/RagA family TonB-linked outer membrane protein [Prevotella shahii]|uniref:SusC/RagA family TonB-linked outer membrane protein n=2 Tax=Hoylesella shahii TaxID=228603 RepID=UPI001CAE1BA6|nr:SusC/RagA family TonB-linked outer membrane protein [Hoylesella shahii]MBF1569406.1 SusC/RagA family TonB-linked outer membrane protein [Hoylesella shahii]